MGRKIDLKGQRFGRWLVLEETGKDKRGAILWLCRCDCGIESIVVGTNLRNGHSKSCGCYIREKLSKIVPGKIIIENLTGFRICTKCKEKFSLTEEYFHKVNKVKSGLNSTCKICRRMQLEQYYRDNREEILERDRKYRKDNKEKLIELQKKRYNDDIQFRLSSVLRSRLRRAIKNGYRSGSAVKDLGISIIEFKRYLEFLFYSNSINGESMTWENYGYRGWHIDHIIPLSIFDLTDRKQFLESCHYTNLQPLWAGENMSKGDKI